MSANSIGAFTVRRLPEPGPSWHEVGFVAEQEGIFRSCTYLERVHLLHVLVEVSNCPPVLLAGCMRRRRGCCNIAAFTPCITSMYSLATL